ncbi:MAG: FAD/NAD(P)-binding protein [Polyangia bacterium]
MGGACASRPGVGSAAAAAVSDADLWLPRPFEVRAVRRETADTFTLGLVPQDGGPPLAFRPGQFNMLLVPGVGEAAISISGDPARPALLRHTVRAVGGVTGQLARLARGDYVGVRGPLGVPWPVEALAGRDLIVIAGGIGLAPLRPVLCHVLRHRACYGRVALVYGARTPADVLFQRDLERLRQRADLQVELTVDHADSAWHGDIGLVTRLLPRVVMDPARAAALVCGPEIMMRSAERELARLGIPDAAIYITMERHMKCGIGLCGRCQLGPYFICKDGPVFDYARIQSAFEMREL